MDTALTERCPSCDQLLYQCVCNKPNLSLAEWLTYGRGKGWISPIVCETHNGLPISPDEAQQFDNQDDPCIFAIRFYTDPNQQESQLHEQHR
jgi:hypothetical protein